MKKEVDVAEFPEIPTSMVNDAIKRYKKAESGQSRQERGRQRAAKTLENICKPRARVQQTPSSQKNSRKKLGKAYGISEGSTANILKQDLKRNS